MASNQNLPEIKEDQNNAITENVMSQENLKISENIAKKTGEVKTIKEIEIKDDILLTNTNELMKPIKVEDKTEYENLAEQLKDIAKLKAQFKRIDAITKQTKQIEKYLNSKHDDSANESQQAEEELSTTATLSSQDYVSETHAHNDYDLLHGSITSNNTASIVEDARTELLSTLTGLFTDYASDLQQQAENLRAERMRIRDLKEKIIASKKGI